MFTTASLEKSAPNMDDLSCIVFIFCHV